MKQTLKRRICAAILCHILLLGLAGCGKANKAKPNDGGDPPVKASVDALKQGQPAADSEETVDGAESFARVRGDLEYDGRLTGAAAYLGLREKGDQTELTDWLRENCADLTSELPFLLEIPSERVLGAGYGKLFHGKVACRGSHSKAFTGKVNGIRAVVERHFKALHISGRRKKFGFSVNHNSALRQRH